jgi:Calpain family cysteine protease
MKWAVIPTSQLYPPTTTTTTTSTAPATAPVTTDWFSQNLHTPAIVSLVRSLDADHTFSRADMLSLFQTVESAGAITSSEMTDLKTIVSNATVLGMPAYVQNLASKVVNGDPANADYLGKPLGNLAVGSSAGQLEALVGKWFLGTDHPAVNASGLTYMYTSGSLFGPNGPQYTNVVQGEVNDCYLMAALGATAVNSPQAISSAFIDNGDGTCTVRFYDNGVAQYVTVDRYLPATTAKKLWYAGMGWSVSNTANVLWVPLLEKAFAELAASGWSQPSAAANSYAAIGEGWEGTALTELTGKSASWSTISNTTTSLNSIVSTFQSGQMVMLDSNPTTASNIVSSHIYVMIGYASSTKTFTLYNPWGSQIQLTWAQLEANFGTFTYSL